VFLKRELIMGYSLVNSIFTVLILFILIPLPVFATNENISEPASTSHNIAFPFTVIPKQTDSFNDEFIDKVTTIIPNFSERKHWLQTYIRKELSGIGMGEVFLLQCHQFSNNNIEHCLIYWQWTQATTWSVMIDAVNLEGDIIAREDFGRRGVLVATLPYNNEQLVIMERGIPKADDVSCCPSGKQLEIYQWNERGLKLVTLPILD
jgi:hypothetical protein